MYLNGVDRNYFTFTFLLTSGNPGAGSRGPRTEIVAGPHTCNVLRPLALPTDFTGSSPQPSILNKSQVENVAVTKTHIQDVLHQAQDDFRVVSADTCSFPDLSKTSFGLRTKRLFVTS
jgi:hypothetical protein